MVSGMVYSATNSYGNATRASQLQDELSIAMDQIVRELRAIPAEPGVDPAAPYLTSVTSTSMQWNTNYALSLASGQVQLVENGAAPLTLLRDVTAFTVSVRDAANGAVATPLVGAACRPVRRIQIDITLSRGGVTQSLRSRVFLRGVMQGA